jgi:hypothetical protein
MSTDESTDKKASWAPILVPSLVAIVVAILSSSLNYQYGLRTQTEVSQRQERRRAYGELMGLKALLRQQYVSHTEAGIFVDYYQARWRLAGSTKDGLDLQEALVHMRRAEALALEIAKTNQRLYETLGVIRTAFRDTSTLQQLIETVYRFGTPSIRGETAKMKAEELETWKAASTKQLQELVEREYAVPIDNLLKYLGAELAEGKK